MTAGGDFARRLALACDGRATAPPTADDRPRWMWLQLHGVYNTATTLEQVRAWFAGEAWPNAAQIKAIAELLEVDAKWIDEGEPDPPPSRWEVTEWCADEAEMQDFTSEVHARAAFEKAKSELVAGATVELTRVIVVDFAERPA